MEAIITKYYFLLARTGLVFALIFITALALWPFEQALFSHWSDKAQHIAAFYVLTYLVDANLPESGCNWKKAGMVLAYGILLECLQWLGYRDFSIADMVADLVAILLYAAMVPLLRKVPVIKWRWTLPYYQR